ncbi:tRNA (N6-isopentenyl adenosine(37)-C2)-methylthiotransferase MiaB [Hoeflea alexandrii]|uniref:tRNA (N6-isopentenyl adenosine(37)-C2)-methylthiotransferase MiaB n=1 Tax=Hoeflea alexandrii TaxID=288436 RepID=UPI0022AE90F7|nr:tRNA (N6-isopentenyl adenosine(37)-C2)-methylthiotransferase MiaB [Hoeflea alexandrii]MCZ4291069.1 tRNA (N6-isopentenyl adenosine(37)-C2)-methylthiotransferase MiaB [Hoeflea alexandrii]
MTHATLTPDAKPETAPAAQDGGQSRKVFVKTYGCQMNVYDSERMGDALVRDGYQTVDTVEAADLILINTCHIREKAAEKVYSQLGRLAKLKRERNAEGGDLMVAVAGCVAQAEGQEIIRRAPVVDVVIGPQTYHRLPEALARARNGESVVETEFPAEDKFDGLPNAPEKAIRARGVAAFLTVQEGCDKFCTFCVVPYTRGAEVSRPVDRILGEAERLAEAGVREITLLGQNVNAWHGKGADGREWGLGELVRRLATIKGIDRIRYTTSHPRDMDDALIAAHRDLPELMPYLHLPVQSGSDRILKAMNRRHTAAEYVKLVERIRAARPDIALSGDFIVGFPGETDADFEDTMQLVREVRYASAFTFKYSIRPGTPGADMEGQVDEAVKTERLAQLQDLINQQTRAFGRECVGKVVDLLLEKPGRNTDQLFGRSPWLQPVIVDAKLGEIGDIVRVRITQPGTTGLYAELVE